MYLRHAVSRQSTQDSGDDDLHGIPVVVVRLLGPVFELKSVPSYRAGIACPVQHMKTIALTCIALIALALLCGGVWWSHLQSPARGGAAASSNPAPMDSSTGASNAPPSGTSKVESIVNVTPRTQTVPQSIHVDGVTPSQLAVAGPTTGNPIHAGKSPLAYGKPLIEGWNVSRYGNGLIESEGEYRLGVKEGLWRYYDESGAVLLEGAYERGESAGVWHAWYENGTRKSVARCDRGQFHGHCEFWNADGSKDKERSGYYEHGELTK